MAGLYFTVGADFNKLQRLRTDITKLKTELKGMDKAANPKEFARLEKKLKQLTVEFDREALAAQRAGAMTAAAGRDAQSATGDFSNLNSMLLKFGGTAAMMQLGKEVINVRGEFQQLEIAFTTMLKSGDKATKLMHDLTRFAAETPFGLQSAASGAKQLLAYGSTAESVIGELRMIGDVAAGTGQSINELVYLYGTLRTQGRAYLMDIRQFAGRGIPIYDELAKVLNTTKDQVNDFVSAGKVGFEQVEQAFKNMTSTGGLYANLMDAQSKSVTGRIEQLTDAIDMMFNDMGQDAEGATYTAIGAATTLVENYETVGEILLGLIATYGVYKAALITVAAVEKQRLVYNKLVAQFIPLETALRKGATAAMIQEAAATRALDTMKGKLITTTKSLLNAIAPNPYVLAAAAVVGLAYGIYKLSTYQTDVEKSQKRLNDVTKEFTQTVEGEKVQIDILFNRLRNAKEGTEKYQKAKDEIINKYGSYLDGLNEEIRSLRNVEGAYKAISAAAIQSAKDRAVSSGTQKAVDAYTEKWGDNIEKIQKDFVKKFGEVRADGLLESLKDSLSNDKELSAEVKSAIDDFNKTVWQSQGNFGGTKTFTSNNVQRLVDEITKSKDILNKEVKSLESIFGPAKQGESKDNVSPVFSNIATEVTTATEKVKKLKQELADLRSGKTSSENYISDIDKKKKELDDAEKKLATLTGKDKSTVKSGESAAEKAKKQSQDMADLMVKMYNEREKADLEAYNSHLENEQKLLDLEEDSFQKKQRQRDLNLDKEVLAIRKRTQELIEKQQEIEKQEWEKNGKKGTFTPTTVTEDDLFAVNPQAKNEIDNALLTAKRTYDKGTEEILKGITDKYQDYHIRRMEMEKNYSRDLKALEESRTEENTAIIDRAIAELNKKRQEDLSSLGLEEFQESIDWSMVFGDLDRLSTDALKNIRGKLQEYLTSAADKLTKEDIKTVSDAIEQMNTAIADRNPIDEIADAYGDYKQAIEAVTKAKEKLDKLEKNTPEYTAAQKALTEAQNRRRDSLVKMTKAVNSMGDKGSQLVNSGREVIDMLESFGVEVGENVTKTLDGIGQIMGGLQSIDLTKPFSIVTSSVSMLTGLGKTIAGIFGAGKSSELSEEQFKQYDNLISTLKELIAVQKDYINSLAGKEAREAYETAIEDTERLAQSARNMGRDWLNSGAKKGFLGIGSKKSHGVALRENLDKFRNEFNRLNLGISYEQLGKRADGLFTMSVEQLTRLKRDLPEFWATLDDNTRSYLDTIIEAGEEADKLLLQLNETLTGISFDSLRDSFKSFLTDADSDASKMAENFEDYMRDAIAKIVIDGLMADRIKNWYNDFARRMDDGDLSASDREALRKEYMQIAEQSKKEYDALREIAGISDASSSSSQTASKGVYEGMSQETGEKLEARNTGIHMRTISIDNTTLTISNDVKNIAGQLVKMSALTEQSMHHMEEIRTIQLNSYYELRDINNNTKPLSRMADTLDRMNDKLDNL